VKGVAPSVLIVLFGSLLLYRLLGLAGVELLATWLGSARAALVTMFLFTAVSHFAPMRKDLIAMLPPGLPRPDVLVFLTGVAEVAGAVGLMLPPTRFWAACGLIALMVLMFPANVSAARRETTIRGRRATALWLRAPMQVLFIAWAWLVR
jgi:uncharacterized membrane protein